MPQAVRDVAVTCGEKLSFNIAPLDLGRTVAKLARTDGAGFGHASIQATEPY